MRTRFRRRGTEPGDDELVNVGDVITYAIDWQNGHDDAREVTITDKLDPNVAYVEGTAEETGGFYDRESHTITWTIKADANSSGTERSDVWNR